MRITVDGKQFRRGDERFHLRGVTYGTFRPRADGHRFPEPSQVDADFAAMREAGFTTVRTYTPPPEDVLQAAAANDLVVLAGIFYPDWRYLVGASRSEVRRVAREAAATVESEAHRLLGDDRVLGVSLGNEIPADVIRWFGTRRIAAFLADLADRVHAIDGQQLVTYANYPTAEYLPLSSLDFLTFNVFLEQQSDFRRYLTRLHHLAGDRPLVLGEVGLDAGTDPDGEKRQADALDWQLATAVERGVAGTFVFSWTDEWWVGDAAVEGWHFGLTHADRSPKPALDVATWWNQRTVADLDRVWPSISVVICAYNAGATLAECLDHTCAIEYPGLEILVVNDGSADDTADIARRYPRVRLVDLPHAGLSVARNAGYEAATGDIVAYLDSDAYPQPEWPYYLALGFDGAMVGGVGGPNVPPPSDPVGAHRVARSPGGPVHVLISDDRAEHVPGCNMAFWREEVLTDVGGFDPIYDAAGDDVDLCWKVLDRGWEIGFHPAALVWHHRRPGARAYFRQQRGYGRAEALVEARHPDRFTPLGTARWKGRIYDSFAPSLLNQRVYRGLFGTGAYQSVYQGGGHVLDLAHQIGLPLAIAAVLTTPLALLHLALLLPAAVGLAAIVALVVTDAARAHPPRDLDRGRFAFRVGVAWLHLGQPLVRLWGRWKGVPEARRDLPSCAPLPGPVTHLDGGVLLLPATGPRAATTAAIVDVLRRDGVRVLAATGWEDHDARLVGSATLVGDLVTSAHPEGCVQIRVRLRARSGRLAAGTAAAVATSLLGLGAVSLVILAALAVETLRGAVRVGPRSRRAIVTAAP
ncbi:glycosyltransferase [Nitriliruptor alkaliphilus]|uniref:glycosyltransferase n=1 Tax=Nitriliruptor alkaliphilus TaxID=427918 RepID=UPI00069620CF|nr:glycosyltransferase [Nitriliruptor alkaliphilus]